MSVWHEVQIEFVHDAVDIIINTYGTSPELINILDIVKEAEQEATDLPEENPKESVRRLTKSNTLLTKAENKIPLMDAKEFNNLRNKIKKAKLANSQTAQEIIH